jgi:hypothetical protein
MHVIIIVGTRAKPLRRDIAEVREVVALREQAISSLPLLVFGMRAPPYTRPWTECCAPRKPSSPTAPAEKPTNFVAALGDARKLARASRVHSLNSGARDFGPSRPCTGYGVTCACESRTTAA